MPHILNGMIFKHDVQNSLNYFYVGLTGTEVMMSNVKILPNVWGRTWILRSHLYTIFFSQTTPYFPDEATVTNTWQ